MRRRRKKKGPPVINVWPVESDSFVWAHSVRSCAPVPRRCLDLCGLARASRLPAVGLSLGFTGLLWKALFSQTDPQQVLRDLIQLRSDWGCGFHQHTDATREMEGTAASQACVCLGTSRTKWKGEKKAEVYFIIGLAANSLSNLIEDS